MVRDRVYLIRVQWGKSSDARPCIILAPPDSRGRLQVAFISANMSLYNPRSHFYLSSADPDYIHLKLPKPECFVDENKYEVLVNELVKPLGELRGELGIKFHEWFGE